MQEVMLANRVEKNARHLAKWAKREAISCYRIYDRDIPEIPITIDTYEGALVINDYRLERQSGDSWLDDMAAAVTKPLGATEVFFKRLIPCEDCPTYFHEGDYAQLKLIRDQWI